VIDDLKQLWDRLLPPRLDWLQVEVSARCNAHCGYCPVTCYRDAWNAALMDSATFARLEPAFSYVGLVFLQGWGEPLLHPDFWSMVGSVKRAGARAGFATNGTSFAKENLAHVLDSGVDVMAVSLAGTTAETHERLRRGCNLTRIESGLEALRREKEASGRSEPAVHIAYLMTRSNWREVKELAALAAKWGASEVVISNLSLVASNEWNQESLLADPALWPQVRDALEHARKLAASEGVGLHYYEPDLSEPQRLCTENVLRSCFVSHRGDVSPCVMTNLSVYPNATFAHCLRGDSHTLERLYFGNVNRQSLPEIWRSEAALGFRRSFQRRIELEDPDPLSLPSPCRHCYKLYERLAG
jgi:MoaA/NifB/PqqE/SkfB family radical SAM enzyme